MKKFLFCFVIFLLLVSCTTTKENAAPEEVLPMPIEQSEEVIVEPFPAPESTVETVPDKSEPKNANEVVATFGAVTITKKDYIDTKAEVELIVEELNKITETSDYHGWLKYLSDDYREHYSNKTTLQETSKQLPIQGITLNTLQDYFKYVFVPPRKNIRVDEIIFTSATTVDVIMKTSSKRYYVYTLAKEKSAWKIVDRISK